MHDYECDVVVIGAGPAGSMAAEHAATGGLDVILIEKRAEIGAPLRCAEGVSKRRLKEIGIEPDNEWISSEIIGTIMRSPNNGYLKVNESITDNEVGYVLDRHIFDKFLAKRAACSGAKVMVRTGCSGLIRDDGKTIGIKARQMGCEITIKADCIVAADGFESQVARWAGIDTTVEPSDIDTCLQYTMTNVDIEPKYCEFMIGNKFAPGGYAWIFPKGDRSANIGLGIQGTKCTHADPKKYLDKLITTDERLKNGQIIGISAGAVSTSPGIKETVDDHIVVVGDAARVINPLTGAGIYHACLTGMLAGDVIAEIGKNGNFSKERLMIYDRLWRGRIEEELKSNWSKKERFVNIDDSIIDGFVSFASSVKMDKVRVEDLVKVAKQYPPIMDAMKRSNNGKYDERQKHCQ